jgi:predicted Rossmann fold flavoprotein
MLFTHFGLSGPIILSMSTEVVDFLRKNKETVNLYINFKPALSKEQLKNRLIRDIALKGSKNYGNFLKELLPGKLIPIFSSLSKIKADKKVNQITSLERENIINLLTNFTLTITKPRPIEEAIVTKGGVSTKEINSKTMESNFIKGLYFCGEIIDVEGKTGGYNLQAAFSTGYLAGQSAAGR